MATNPDPAPEPVRVPEAVARAGEAPDSRGDLYEGCCPHCGFCGDEHKFECRDCAEAWAAGTSADPARPDAPPTS